MIFFIKIKSTPVRIADQKKQLFRPSSSDID